MTTRDRPPAARRRAVILASLVAVVGIGAFLAWRAVAPHAASANAEPTYQRVALATYVESVPAPGTLQPFRRVELRAVTGGTLEWAADVGERVAAGDVVARLVTLQLERAEHDARLALERAQRQLANARQDQAETDRSQRSAVEHAERRVVDTEHAVRERIDSLAVVTRLAELGTETQASLRAARDALADAEREAEAARRDLDDALATRAARVARVAQDVIDAQASVAQAEVTLERAAEDLAAATLRAPLAGVVDAVDASAGSVVSANGLVMTIVDDERLLLATQVDETEVGRIAVGLEARVSVTAMPQLPVQAQVVAVSPSARTVQNIPVFDVTLEVANPTLALRPGMTAEADIVLREVEDTFSVPSRAVTLGGGGTPDAAAFGSARAALGEGGAGGAIVGRAGIAGLDAGARAGLSATRSGDTRLGAVRVREADGSMRDVPVEVVATIGGTVVLRGAVPDGAEVEVPPVAATASAASTGGGLPFGIGGVRGVGGVFR